MSHDLPTIYCVMVVQSFSDGHAFNLRFLSEICTYLPSECILESKGITTIVPDASKIRRIQCDHKTKIVIIIS